MPGSATPLVYFASDDTDGFCAEPLWTLAFREFDALSDAQLLEDHAFQRARVEEHVSAIRFANEAETFVGQPLDTSFSQGALSSSMSPDRRPLIDLSVRASGLRQLL
jgi:hypothetical protein